MAAPEKELPGGAGHGRLRASHTDRDGVVGTLKSAYVLGFVTKDEFDARVSQTLAARTYAELAVVTTDLPIWLAAAQPPGRAAAGFTAPARAALRPVERAIPACALLAAIAFAAAIISDDGWLALGAVGSALTSLVLVAVQIGTARRRQQPPGGQLRGPGQIDSGSGAAAPGSAPESPRAIQRGRVGDGRPQSGRSPHPLLSC
jgi:hypothetical protein